MPTQKPKLQILLLAHLVLSSLYSCDASHDKKPASYETEKPVTQFDDFTLSRPLQVGDKITLSGGYDYDPVFLKNPPASSRTGTVIKFITGQNQLRAAVVKLDEKITGEKITGDIVVLELRYAGQTWQKPTPVHIELCDFIPEDKEWKDRKQGEWVEAAATVRLVQPAK